MSFSSDYPEQSEEGFVPDSFSDKKRNEQEENPVDLDEAVREFGDLAFVEELMGKLRDDIDGRLSKIHDALESGNFDILAREAHAIKGGAMTLEAAPLAAAAKALEQAGDGKCRNDAVSAFEKLQAEVRRFRDFIASRNSAKGNGS